MKKIHIIGLVLVLLFTRNPWAAAQRRHSGAGVRIHQQGNPVTKMHGNPNAKAHANSNSIFGPWLSPKRTQSDRNMNDQDTRNRSQENRKFQYEMNSTYRKYKK